MHQLLSIVGTWWPALIISGNDAPSASKYAPSSNNSNYSVIFLTALPKPAPSTSPATTSLA